MARVDLRARSGPSDPRGYKVDPRRADRLARTVGVTPGCAPGAVARGAGSDRGPGDAHPRRPAVPRPRRRGPGRAPPRTRRPGAAVLRRPPGDPGPAGPDRRALRP